MINLDRIYMRLMKTSANKLSRTQQKMKFRQRFTKREIINTNPNKKSQINRIKKGWNNPI